MIKSNSGFYVGDPCYVVSDELWDKFCSIGKYNDCKDNSLGFLSHSTYIGDGCYGGNGTKYAFPVDSGTLGVVPLELVQDMDKAKQLGHIFLGDTVDMAYQDGVFRITVQQKGGFVELIEIDTK